MVTNESIESTCIVIPEGGADKVEFIDKLLHAHEVEVFQVMREAEGDGKFGQRIAQLKAARGFRDVELIVLVTDSGDSAAKKLRDMWKTQLRKLRRGTMKDIKKPAAPWQVSSGKPRLAVVTLPGPEDIGGLETLLLGAIRARDEDSEQAVTGAEAFIADMPTKDLGPEKLSKAHMACAVAAICEDDPSCAVSRMWETRKGFMPILTDTAFDPLVTFFRDLEGFCLGNAE